MGSPREDITIRTRARRAFRLDPPVQQTLRACPVGHGTCRKKTRDMRTVSLRIRSGRRGERSAWHERMELALPLRTTCDSPEATPQVDEAPTVKPGIRQPTLP